jgi:hypothetical protein
MAVVDDPVLGPVVLEMSGRLLRQLEATGTLVPEGARAAVISCLALLVGQVLTEAASGADVLAPEGRDGGR